MKRNFELIFIMLLSLAVGTAIGNRSNQVIIDQVIDREIAVWTFVEAQHNMLGVLVRDCRKHDDADRCAAGMIVVQRIIQRYMIEYYPGEVEIVDTMPPTFDSSQGFQTLDN